MWREIYLEFRRWAKASDHAIAAYKRTEITVETDQVLIIRRHRSQRVWCAECGREVDTVGLDTVGLKEAAANYVGKQPPLPDGDGRAWHRVQASDGTPLICLESLRLR